jgi:hypothetical protein
MVLQVGHFISGCVVECLAEPPAVLERDVGTDAQILGCRFSEGCIPRGFGFVVGGSLQRDGLEAPAEEAGVKPRPRLSIPFLTEKVEVGKLHAFKDDPVEPVEEDGTDLFIPEETVE